MKPMLLTAATDIPIGKDWLYETKYDGFRCLMEWEEDIPILKSRNGKVLNLMFPEILSYCETILEKMRPFLPLSLDGELVYLTNDFNSNFSVVQVRGRMRKENVIRNHAQNFPCHYVVFDLLTYKGNSLTGLTISDRKKQLNLLCKDIQLPTSVMDDTINRIQAIEVYRDHEKCWDKVVVSNGEGIVAKQVSSNWNSGKRTSSWLKIKNWKYVTVILTKYDKNNGYFHGAVYRYHSLVEIVHVLHGFKEDELKTLITLFQTNGTKVSDTIWELEPSICVDIACIGFDDKHLREPRFHAFNFNKEVTDCNWKQMERQLFPLPEIVQVTSPDKPIWPEIGIEKDDYLLYLQHISPFMLPFLKDRLLTVIRYPHGFGTESFYQKNVPDYAPAFITTHQEDDIRYMMCNDIESLLWLGNQLALEYHIPFQTIHSGKPTEIVFDLDPPSVEEFTLAVEAALRMKAILDQFNLPAYVKTSGGKGLQVYIPLPEDTFSYKETRVFTKFVCEFLCEQEPQWFTTERLKKNRNNKLYLDYVQHHEGKTIIAPYSPRGNANGLIATPLNWTEVNDSLKPDLFSIPSVLERIKKQGNPFRNFRIDLEAVTFTRVLNQLEGNDVE